MPTTCPERSLGLLTLPDAAERLGIRVDRMRRLVTRIPAASAMFTKVGASNCIPSSRLPELSRLLAGQPSDLPLLSPQ